MGYKISYGKKAGTKVKKSFLFSDKCKKCIVLGIFVVMLAGTLFFGRKYDLFQTHTSNTVKHAFNDMVSSLKNGDSIGQSIYTFCEEVFTEANAQE